jgi:hypothetical protein
VSTQAGSGGSAAQAGIGYQNRVCGWLVVRILGERDVEPVWGLPGSDPLQDLSCETTEAVDDFLGSSEQGRRIFGQAKRAVSAGTSVSGEFAATIDQFVRLIRDRGLATENQSGSQHLDPERDELVLVTSSDSSTPIRADLPRVLERIRGSNRGTPPLELARNQSERRVLEVLLGHFVRLWTSLSGQAPTDDETRAFLALLRIRILDVEPGDRDEDEAKNMLRQAVLADPDDADQAWALLLRECASLASGRRGATRNQLQRILTDAGLSVQTLRSYRADVHRLRAHAESTVAALFSMSQFTVGARAVRIERPVVDALKSSLEDQAVVVVGEPGSGKSGVLHDVANQLLAEDRDLVFLAADRIDAQTDGALRADIGLEHNILDVLENWQGEGTAFLMIDALDAARSEFAARTLTGVLEQLENPRWRAAVSIRKYDLRYGNRVQQLFIGQPPTAFQDPEFARISHLNVPPLDSAETSQIGSQSPELAALIVAAPRQLADLLTNPFNLRLAGELLGAGIGTDELTPISTQLGLLERYWLHRVISDHGRGDTRERVLRTIIDTMLAAHALRAPRLIAADEGNALGDLLSAGVLSEWLPPGSVAPERQTLTFAHQVLFDYAAERLVLRDPAVSLADRLASDHELVLAIRPSLILHYEYLWAQDGSRSRFWDTALSVTGNASVPETGKLIGPTTAVDLATTIADFNRLTRALQDTRDDQRDAAEQAFSHTGGALMAPARGSGSRVTGTDAGPWLSLAAAVSQNLRLRPAFAVRAILMLALDERSDPMTADQLADAGLAARRLLEFALHQEPRNDALIASGIDFVCDTVDSDVDSSIALLDRLLTESELQAHGYFDLPRLSRHV